MTRETILHIHSFIGAIIFAAGILQIVLKKGGKTHSIIGQVYVYGWVFLLVSGAYLGGLVITLIGIFGFYFALTGARMGTLKGKPVTVFDKGIFALGGLISLSLLYYAVSLYLKGDTSFAIIFAVFGGIFLMQTAFDISKYILEKPIKKNVYGKMDWYFEHFTRMCVSFIAAVTAFTSIQNVFGDNTLNFLLPTVIGIILIKLAERYYKKKFIK